MGDGSMSQEQDVAEYRFHIDAFSPETIPLERLAEYLGYIARIFGEKESVHFVRLEGGSTTPILRVDREALPKVRERIDLMRVGEDPIDSRAAIHELNKRLAEDNATGVLVDPLSAKVLRFPGREAANHVQFGPLSESGSFEGIPIKVGGERQDVPVHLQDADQVHIIYAPRRIAIDIAKHLFTSPIRVRGEGKWTRNRMGEWIMHRFLVDGFDVLDRRDLEEAMGRLQGIQAEWKSREDPLRDLAELRNGEANA